MPRRLGDRPLTNAERKQRYRERLRGGAPVLTFADAARANQQRRRLAEADARGPLFRRMAREATGGLALDDLTVLAAANDPYRVDTPARRRDGQWLADQVARLVPHGTVHLRGLHYRIVAAGDVRKPNGEIYRNTDADWTWLGEDAAKAARWLGFVPFDHIVDEKNEPAEVFTPEDLAGDFGQPLLVDGFELDLPDPDSLMPVFYCHAGVARQPYRLILIGEKSSLRPILAPLASIVGGELILPSGESEAVEQYRLNAPTSPPPTAHPQAK
jgi:hypothetical protein